MDISPQEKDLLVRTMVGEADDQPDVGKAAVGYTALNRLASGKYGKSLTDVLLQKNAYEPWSTRARELMAIKPDSPRYQHMADIADGVINGDIPDPTVGASHFLQEDIVRKRRGGSLPNWASGPGMRIGDHTFYRPDGGGAAIDRAIGASPGGAPASALAFDEPGKLFRDAGFDVPGGPPAATAGASAGSTPADAPPGSPRTLRVTVPLNPAQPPVRPGSLFEDAGFALPTREAQDSVEPEAPQAPAKPPVYDVAKEAALAAKFGGGSGSVVEGMPIIGPLAQKGVAAANAAIDPLFGRGGDLPFGERYDKNLEIARGAQKVYDEQHPLLSTLLGAGGAMATLSPLAGAVPVGQRLASGAASYVLPATGAAHNITGRALGTVGNSIGARFWQGLAGGAAIGAGDAALRGENPWVGGAAGGAGNALGVVGGEALGRGVSALTNMVRPAPAGLQGTNLIARDWLSRAMANETPASIAAARTRMGPTGFAADLNHSMTSAAAKLAARGEPPGGAEIAEAYRIRHEGQRGVIENAITSALGPRINLANVTRSGRQARSQASRPLYEAWERTHVSPTPALEHMSDELHDMGFFRDAQRLLRADNRPAYHFTGVDGEHYPTAEAWDYVKQAIDGRIRQNMPTALSAGNPNEVRVYTGLRNRLVNALDNHPDPGVAGVWRMARESWANPTAIMNAREAGGDLWSNSVRRDELAGQLRRYSGPERVAFREGARDSLAELMDATRRGDTTARNKLLAPANQEKIRAISPTDAHAQRLIDTLQEQEYLAGQHQFVNPRAGSATAGRTDSEHMFDPPALPKWEPSFTKPFSWVPPAWIDELRPSTIIQGGRSASYANARRQMAHALITPEGAGLDALLRGLRAETTARGRVADRAALLGRAATLALEGPGSDTLRKQGRMPTLLDLRNALVSDAQ